jgi:hypothetical protein
LPTAGLALGLPLVDGEPDAAPPVVLLVAGESAALAASATSGASGPAASAIASSRENIAILAFIENLLRNDALKRTTTAASAEQRTCHPTAAMRHRRAPGAVRPQMRRGIMRRF